MHDSIDKRDQQSRRQPLTLRPLALRRRGTRQRLTNHSPVYSQLARHPFYRTKAELVFPPDLLE
jgi:hypothetical protein